MCAYAADVTTPSLSQELSNLTHNVDSVTDLIRRAHAKELTPAALSAVRAMLGELDTFVRRATTGCSMTSSSGAAGDACNSRPGASE